MMCMCWRHLTVTSCSWHETQQTPGSTPTLILLHQTNTHIFYLSKSYSESSDPLLWLINNYSAGLLRYEARDGIKHINLTSVSKLRDHFNTGHFNTRYLIQARLVECCSTIWLHFKPREILRQIFVIPALIFTRTLVQIVYIWVEEFVIFLDRDDFIPVSFYSLRVL